MDAVLFFRPQPLKPRESRQDNSLTAHNGGGDAATESGGSGGPAGDGDGGAGQEHVGDGGGWVVDGVMSE